MNEGKKCTDKTQHKGSDSRRRKVRVAVGEAWDGVRELNPEPQRRDPSSEGQRLKTIVMMVVTFFAVALIFLLYLFAFVKDNANMMGQIMTIAQLALGAALAWAGARTVQRARKSK